MFAFYSKVHLKLVLNSEVDIQPGRDVQDFLSDIFGCSMGADAPDLSYLSGSDVVTWTVVCTRADFRPAHSVWDLNHWVPCLTSGSSLSERLKAISDAFDEERAYFFGEAADDPNNNKWTDEQVDSLMDYVNLLTERAQNLKRLSARLHPLDQLCPVAVPAEGNCGIWSLLCFLRQQDGSEPDQILQEDPLGTRVVRNGISHEMKQRMRSLRQCLRDEWVRIADTPQAGWWAKLFQMLVVNAGGEEHLSKMAEPTPAASDQPGQDIQDIPQVSVKKEPVTPDAKRKHHNQFDAYSPLVIKKGRNNHRAGILRDRVVDGPSVPLKLSHPEKGEPKDGKDVEGFEGQKIEKRLPVKAEVKAEVKVEVKEEVGKVSYSFHTG